MATSKPWARRGVNAWGRLAPAAGSSPMKGGVQGLGMPPTACHPADRRGADRARGQGLVTSRSAFHTDRTVCGCTCAGPSTGGAFLGDRGGRHGWGSSPRSGRGIGREVRHRRWLFRSGQRPSDPPQNRALEMRRGKPNVVIAVEKIGKNIGPVPHNAIPGAGLLQQKRNVCA